MSDDVTLALKLIENEVKSAMNKHPPMHNAHEAYAIILEELDEFWAEVRGQDHAGAKDTMRAELLHTAAMCVRALVDLKMV